MSKSRPSQLFKSQSVLSTHRHRHCSSAIASSANYLRARRAATTTSSSASTTTATATTPRRHLTKNNNGLIAPASSAFKTSSPSILQPHQHLSRTFHSSTRSTMASATSFYDFKPLDKRGQPYPLTSLKNKVVLIVNTASKCGFTPQFEGLESLYKTVSTSHPKGSDFVVLGFPCNQFGGQDPGSNDEIQSFCQVNYGVTFPVLGKVDVNGDKADPLFEWLKKEMPGLMGLKRVKWNFEKFLVGRDGQVKGRWASTTKPESLKEAVEAELAK
ncbi:glutathione peroxidase-like protein [Phyllosticta capitalensis]